MAYKPPKQQVVDNDLKNAPSNEAVFEELKLRDTAISNLDADKLSQPPVLGTTGQLLQLDGYVSGEPVMSWVNPPASGANTSLSNLDATTAVNSVLLGQDGTVTTPAFSFISDTNTGIYRSTTDTLGIAAGGGIAATIAKNTFTVGGSNSGEVILNITAPSNFSYLRTNGNTIFQFGNGRLIGVKADSWLLLTNDSTAQLGFSIASTSWSQAASYNIGAIRNRLMLGPKRSTVLVNGGVISATSPAYANTSQSTVTAYGTNILTVNNLGGADYDIQNRSRILMGIGEKIAISKSGFPTLIAKILSATQQASWWIVDYTLDITVSTDYSGGSVQSRPTLFIASKNDYTEVFSIDYDGAVNLDGALIVNESGADKDTRIEGDTDANLIFVDAGTDRVGIGTATPGEKLEVNGNAKISNGNVSIATVGKGLQIKTGSNATMGITNAFAGGGSNPNEVTVSTTAVTTNSLIFLTPQSNPSGHHSDVYISAKSAGQFTITAEDNQFEGTVAWIIIEAI